MNGFKVVMRPKPLVDPARVAAFGAGAEARVEQGDPPDAVACPAVADDKRRIPAFVLRLTAREAAALKGISETTPNSRHEFCIKAIRAALELQ